jgi:hypothetical protein
MIITQYSHYITWVLNDTVKDIDLRCDRPALDNVRADWVLQNPNHSARFQGEAD